MLRSTLMQMRLQTAQPFVHLILINGPLADAYDLRLVEDLLCDTIHVRKVSKPLVNRQSAGLAVKQLLTFDIDAIAKIDSDDVYATDYLEQTLRAIEGAGLWDRTTGFCSQLYDQFWLRTDENGSGRISKAAFEFGLGLTDQEIDRGLRVGAPPTTVIDVRAARLVASHFNDPAYRMIASDDITWRTLLFDHGIKIERLKVRRGIFFYHRHGSNTCSLDGEHRTESKSHQSMETLSVGQQIFTWTNWRSCDEKEGPNTSVMVVIRGPGGVLVQKTIFVDEIADLIDLFRESLTADVDLSLYVVGIAKVQPHGRVAKTAVFDAAAPCYRLDDGTPILRRESTMTEHEVSTVNPLFVIGSLPRYESHIHQIIKARVKLFEQTAGYFCQLITFDYNADTPDLRRELLSRNEITDGTEIVNFYDSHQFGGLPPDDSLLEMAMDLPGDRVPAERSGDWRILDSGELIAYESRDPLTGRLRYINHIRNGRKWRRDTFTPAGILSRTQTLDQATENPLVEYYFRKDGTVAISQHYVIERGESRCVSILLHSLKGSIQRFDSIDQAFADWLANLVDRQHHLAVLICDRNRSLRAICSEVRNKRPDRTRLVNVLHGTHTEGRKTSSQKKLVPDARFLSANPCSSDAVVVSTERQRSELSEQFSNHTFTVVHPFKRVGWSHSA